MSRPENKAALIAQSQAGFNALENLALSMGEQGLMTPFPEGMLNRNARDVIAHLHHWHLLFLGWYEVGIRGEKPVMPAEGYTWKDTQALNLMINKKYANSQPLEIWEAFVQTHSRVMTLMKEHPAETLFEKKYYKWTGSTSLGAYLVSASSSHYAWAFAVIRKALANKP